MSINQESIRMSEETTKQETPNNLLSPKGAIVFPSNRAHSTGTLLFRRPKRFGALPT